MRFQKKKKKDGSKNSALQGGIMFNSQMFLQILQLLKPTFFFF